MSATMTATAPMVGRPAPDFDLECIDAPGMRPRRISLADYRGKWLVAAFYPHDFSLVCPTELSALGSRIAEFHAMGAEILGVSTDTIASHEMALGTPRNKGGVGGLAYPLASDPDGSVCRAFGIYVEESGVALRGLYIIDPEGVLQYQVVHNMNVGRRSEEVLRVLAALQTGGLCGEAWSAEEGEEIEPTEELSPGRVISHYRIEEVIGSGTFSIVYRAHDLTLDRDVAVKVFRHAQPAQAKSALAEARAAASLNHPNLCTIHAVDDDGGASMIVMEYLPGRTVAEILDDGPMEPCEASRLLKQVAHGLVFAHNRGLVHGDLKPANIMVLPNGMAKVLDFGLARLDSPMGRLDLDATVDAEDLELELEGLSGTPSYMAPEQARGESPTQASDVFALGVIARELITGKKTFPGANLLQVLSQIARVDPDRLSADLPEPFDELVRRALAPEPADRTLEMRDIARILPGAPCPLVTAPA